MADDKSGSRLYIGNLDRRITEANLIKMFAPFGKIIFEDFLLHTRGPKRGEPRGYAFIQYSSAEEAQLAKEKMDGRLACGRLLVVRFVNEKHAEENTCSLKSVCVVKKPNVGCSTLGQINRDAKIAAIKNKLKSLEEEGVGSKKRRLAEN